MDSFILPDLPLVPGQSLSSSSSLLPAPNPTIPHAAAASVPFDHDTDHSHSLTPLSLRSGRMGDSELIFLKSVHRRLLQGRESLDAITNRAQNALANAGIQNAIKTPEDLKNPFFPPDATKQSHSPPSRKRRHPESSASVASSSAVTASDSSHPFPLLELPSIDPDQFGFVTPFHLIERAIQHELRRLGYSDGPEPQDRKKPNKKDKTQTEQNETKTENDNQSAAASSAAAASNDLWITPSTLSHYGLPADFGSGIPGYEEIAECLAAIPPIRREPVKRDANVVTDTSIRFQIGKRVREFIELQKRKTQNQAINENPSAPEATPTPASVPAPIPAPAPAASSAPVSVSDSISVPSISPNELLLRLTFFHPRTYERHEEFLCTGSNLLSELRDRLECLSDLPLDPNIPRFPSSYFLIENTFYEDLRDRYAIRYSTTVIDWIASQPERADSPGLHYFEASEMDKVKFLDLAIRLGSVYFFVHQCDCIHPFIVEEVRLATKHDPTPAPAYPLTIWKARVHRAKCNICDVQRAHCVTFDDKYASINPCFWCENCYKMYHFDQTGKPLYQDYKVFTYVHD